MSDLFPESRARVPLDPGAVLLGGYALPHAEELLAGIAAIAAAAPFRRMETPGGGRMSVAMTNAGLMGWTTSRRGYRYVRTDPDSGRDWPDMPGVFSDLATTLAMEAGFRGFFPDACLVNRYAAGSRMALHQDRDEADFDQPIVSVSLGLPARFLWGGAERTDHPRRIALLHGDALVWGGASRLTYHGVDPVAHGSHPLTGDCRFNLTFRCTRTPVTNSRPHPE